MRRGGVLTSAAGSRELEILIALVEHAGEMIRKDQMPGTLGCKDVIVVARCRADR